MSRLTQKIIKRIPPQLRRQVWEKYIIDKRLAYGPCYVCNGEIHITTFECGHVISNSQGGPIELKNLRPICSSCNKSVGKQNLNEYKAKFFRHILRQNKLQMMRPDLNSINVRFR